MGVGFVLFVFGVGWFWGWFLCEYFCGMVVTSARCAPKSRGASIAAKRGGLLAAGEGLDDVDFGILAYWVGEVFLVGDGGAVDEDVDVFAECVLIVEDVVACGLVLVVEEVVECFADGGTGRGGGWAVDVALDVVGEVYFWHGGFVMMRCVKK